MDVQKKTIQSKANYTISPEGSLGVLAIGDEGLRAWRKVRREFKKEGIKREKK